MKDDRKLPSKVDLRKSKDPDVKRRLRYAEDMVNAINSGDPKTRKVLLDEKRKELR
jgi:hypothetical protein